MPAPRRRTFGRLVAVSAVGALSVTGTLMYAATAGATVSTVSTITAVGPHLVSALSANQVITVTGTGFDETAISGVTVGTCTAVSYIVVSPTSLALKTDATCPVAAGVVVTVTDNSGDAVSVPGAVGGAQALSFIAAPSLATPVATSARPVTTSNSSALTFAQVTAHGLSASTKGGTVIKVTSGATGFANTTTYPLSATLGGVALTGVTLVGVGAGNYFTGIVGAHAADAAPVLKITNNGVSKSFPWTANASAVAGTHDFTYAGSTIVVTPNFGASNGGNKITITGAGFSLTGGNDVVTVGGVSCPLTTPVPTATTITCTVPITTLAALEGPAIVQVAVTGGLTSVVGSGSTYTYVAK
jgi:hypothetical protein